MRVGILDIIALPSTSIRKNINRFAIAKQFTSIAPQVMATWSRQLGHETYYANYYGVGKPEDKLPADLDFVLIACFTQSSPFAYALANYYRKQNVTTVLGGSHARSFPVDALRFFDIVVHDCDKELLKGIFNGDFSSGSHLTTSKPLTEVPSVEERMPDILSTAFFFKKHRTFLTSIPMLMSTGCPYDCNFCSEWDKPYNQFSKHQLLDDLKYVSKHFPKVLLQFQDPNFAVRFDEILSTMEQIEPERRPPYITQSSLTILKDIMRMQRMRDTNCVVIAPGIESWSDYSNKSAVGATQGTDKVKQVADHLNALGEFIPYCQANLMFGLDTDQGSDPIRLSKEFIDRTPAHWPALNIPVPFGGTPMFDNLIAENRVLKNLPFLFYYNPYLAVTLKHYSPVEYYEKLIDLAEHITRPEGLRERMKHTRNPRLKVLHWMRTIHQRSHLDHKRIILNMLKSDSAFLAFHEGRSDSLPDYYHREYDNMLGNYGDLLKPSDRYTDLSQQEPQVVH